MMNKIVTIVIIIVGSLILFRPQSKPVNFTTLTSAQLATMLNQKDFFFITESLNKFPKRQNISHLSGGMREWQSNGLEIVRKP